MPLQSCWMPASGFHKTSHRHMTKSDAMGDKYGLSAEGSTKGAQLSTAENSTTWKTLWLLCRKCCLSHQAMPCQVVVRLDAVNLCNSHGKGRLCGTRVLLQRGNDKIKSGWRCAITKHVMECYWNEEAFTRDYSWVLPDNGVLTEVII